MNDDYDLKLDVLKKEPRPWNPDLASDLDYIIPFDCLARDIQQWILSTSIYPQPAIAYAAALSIISVCIGRDIAVENIKGNLMFICMAESGEGKDWPFKSVHKILKSLDMAEDHICKKMASGAALMNALESSSSILCHLDEMGNYLAAINGSSANPHAKEVVGITTECYTCADTEFIGKSTKDKKGVVITEPNLCVFGLSTERQVFDGLNTSSLADGSLARYSVLFGEKMLMPKRLQGISREVPEKIILGLEELITKYQKQVFFVSQQLKLSDEYYDLKWKLVCDMKERGNQIAKAGGEKASFVPFYNRIAVRSIQTAMLIDQCQSVDVLNWVSALDLSGVELFIKKFRHLGADNDNERMAKLIESRIKESGLEGISKKRLTSLTRKVTPQTRKLIVEDLLDNGSIYTEQIKKENKQRPECVYFWAK